ncbi:efflux RND transporter periplasmic adaptor subunit [Candidatus Nitrospira bockiana]
MRGCCVVLAVCLGGAAVPQAAWAGTTLPCLVKPQTVVTVGAPVVGVLKGLSVAPGDRVKQGDLLATLESSLEESEVALARAKAENQAAVKSAEERAAFAARKAARARELRKSSAIAQHELDEAETEERLAQDAHHEALENKRLAELELKRAQAALTLRTVHSPIDGMVVARFLSPGELVKQTPILKLAQLDPLQVEVSAPVSWLGKITPGARAEVLLDAPPGGAHQARVLLVTPMVDSGGGLFSVTLELPNPQHRIPAGLSCTVRFPAS